MSSLPVATRRMARLFQAIALFALAGLVVLFVQTRIVAPTDLVTVAGVGLRVFDGNAGPPGMTSLTLTIWAVLLASVALGLVAFWKIAAVCAHVASDQVLSLRAARAIRSAGIAIALLGILKMVEEEVVGLVVRFGYGPDPYTGTMTALTWDLAFEDLVILLSGVTLALVGLVLRQTVAAAEHTRSIDPRPPSVSS